MSALTGRTQNDTYLDLLHIENSNLGFDGALRFIESGSGNASSLSLSTISARFAGTASFVGQATFDLAPTIGGDSVFYAGFMGVGSGLDAETLDGNLASAFAVSSDPLTITGAWEFQTPPLFSRANNLELAQFQDTTNNRQMQAIFDTNLDFGLVPGSGGSFTAADRFYWDSSAVRWATVNGFNITGAAGALSVGGAGTLSAAAGDLDLTSTASITINSAADIIADLSGDMDLISTGGTLTVDFDTSIDMSTTIGAILVSAGTALEMDGASVALSALSGTVEIDGTEIILNRSGAIAFQTQNPIAAALTVSSAQVRDGGNFLRDVGFNVLPTTGTSIGFDLEPANCGYKTRYTGVGPHAATVTTDANNPDGGAWVVLNAGTATLAINITTLSWYDGSGSVQTGNRVLAVGGVATISKRTTGQYEIWGAGLT